MCHAKVSLQKFFHAVLNVQVGLFRVFFLSGIHLGVLSAFTSGFVNVSLRVCL